MAKRVQMFCFDCRGLMKLVVRSAILRWLPCALIPLGLVLGTALSKPRPMAFEFSSRGLAWTGQAKWQTRKQANELPDVMFWAWQRPEDFRFLKPGQAGVAFLAETIVLHIRDSVALSSLERRIPTLRVGKGTALIAVVRIENPTGTGKPITNDGSQPSVYRPETVASVAEAIAELQHIPGISGIQIDFDAPASAHGFYAELLKETRKRIEPGIPLSITALASWCIGDQWLAQLPGGTIEEAVPMLFRMGPDAENVAEYLHSNDKFPVAACNSSLGLSIDEKLSRGLLHKLGNDPGDGKRVYVFSPRAWTPAEADEVLKELNR